MKLRISFGACVARKSNIPHWCPEYDGFLCGQRQPVGPSDRSPGLYILSDRQLRTAMEFNIYDVFLEFFNTR